MLFNKKTKVDYVATKEFKGMIAFNDVEKTFKVKNKIYNFSDLVDVDLIIDDYSVTKGGLGKAVAGGILLGPLGAIVGGVTSKKKNKNIVDNMNIVLQVNDFQEPKINISLIKSPLNKNGVIYKMIESMAQEIMGTLEYILRSR